MWRGGEVERNGGYGVGKWEGDVGEGAKGERLKMTRWQDALSKVISVDEEKMG